MRNVEGLSGRRILFPKICDVKILNVSKKNIRHHKTNAGLFQMFSRSLNPDARRRKHFVVIITADVKTKHVIGIDVRNQGTGLSDPEAAQKHVGEAVMRGMNVTEFYG